MRCIATLTFLAVLSGVCPANAQSNMPAHHAPVRVIDGAVNPELIPDLTAYRLYLLTISKPPNPTDEQTKRTDADTRKAGLQEPDRLSLVAIADDFNYQYHNMVKAYNDAATAAWKQGQRSDLPAFRRQRDQLVQSTIDRLNHTLTPGGWSTFNTYVQAEKRRMKIAAPEVGQ